MSKIVVDLQTGLTSSEPLTTEELDQVAANKDASAAIDARAKALRRVSEIRASLIDLLADNLTGNPSEQGIANAAIGLLRAELAQNKTKL